MPLIPIPSYLIITNNPIREGNHTHFVLTLLRNYHSR